MVDRGLLAKVFQSKDSGSPSPKEIYERCSSTVGLADLNRPCEGYENDSEHEEQSSAFQVISK